MKRRNERRNVWKERTKRNGEKSKGSESWFFGEREKWNLIQSASCDEYEPGHPPFIQVWHTVFDALPIPSHSSLASSVHSYIEDILETTKANERLLSSYHSSFYPSMYPIFRRWKWRHVEQQWEKYVVKEKEREEERELTQHILYQQRGEHDGFDSRDFYHTPYAVCFRWILILSSQIMRTFGNSIFPDWIHQTSGMEITRDREGDDLED